ncbi:hypothetical protein [Aestuariivirga sp.]|nr:hypothetical protein [Aestuariivirga sp.]MCA3556290.1 hypothetical protein [Aestuariivirga sp.]
MVGIPSADVVAVLAYPWIKARPGRDAAGRADAAINVTLFVCAFAAQ